MKKNVLIALFMLPLAIFAQAPGTLDTSFGNGGTVIIDNGNLDLFNDVVVQDDQKIVAIGMTYDASFVASTQAYRFLPDGSLDMTFATNGIFTYSLNAEANVFDVLIKEDGKILMVGSTTDYNDYRILLIQLNENGSLDGTFGVGGVVVQKVSPITAGFFEDFGTSVAMQDNKILVAGSLKTLDYNNAPMVVRFNENGELDTTFGDAGVVTIPVIESENVFDSLVVQDDGKIVASGHYSVGLNYFAMLVVRFMPNGTLDTTFGNNGQTVIPLGADAESFGMKLTAENKIVVAGFTASPQYNYDMLLMQFDTDGNLDAGFGVDGIVVSNLGNYDVGSAIHIQEDGKILVAGGTGEGAPNDVEMAVWRYLADGTADITFGVDGIAKVQISGQVDEALGMALQADGNIVIAGKARNANNNHDFIVARMLNDLELSTPGFIANTSQSIAPNPVAAGGNLHISYEITEATKVQIEVYNLIGALVYVADLGYHQTGLQMLTFTVPAYMSTGIFYIRTRTKGSVSNTSKLIVTE
ncbi:MAG: T9SS type A sorting domain-containing protein [Aequorivita antarctica]